MPYFNHNELKLYYETYGKGSPILLINGLGCDTRSWEPLVKLLKPHFTVITYDMRCAGKSDKPSKPFTIEDLTNEAEALINYLGYPKVNLLGFSMGGMVAMNLSIKHPESIERLFLISTAPSLKQPFPPTSEAMNILHQTEISETLLTDVFELTFGPNYRKRNSVEAFIKFRMTDNNPQPVNAYLAQLKASEEFNLTDKASKIKTDTTIIAGDSDNLVSPKNSEWLHDNIKYSGLHILRNVGHMSPIEAPKTISDIIKTISS